MAPWLRLWLRMGKNMWFRFAEKLILAQHLGFEEEIQNQPDHPLLSAIQKRKQKQQELPQRTQTKRSFANDPSQNQT